MPIKKRLAQVRATSTHCGNEEKFKIEEGDHEAMNHMSADTLIDPEDRSSGSTHTSVTASTGVGNLDNDIDPAAGYLDDTLGEITADFDDEDLGEEDEIDASFDLENSNKVTPLVTAEPMEDEWDNPPPADGDDLDEDNWDEPADDIEETADVESDIESDIVDDAEAPLDVEDTPIVNSHEELPILDVDETRDDDTDNVAFASFGTRLLVVKANRIIATMTKTMAAASGRSDVYLSDQFQEVAASELNKKGLRKGLKSMGFALAKVNVSKAATVNARVQLEVNKTTAAVRKVSATKEAAFQQSLTIAAVGINRRYFNDQPNELKAHLETELQRAGLRGGNRLLQRAFAAYGPAYAKSIVDLANKISAMPQESRDGYVSALDLTSEDMDEPEEDVVPVGFDAGDSSEPEEDEEFVDDTVEATLATAGIRHKAKAVSGSYSVSASAILSGDKPLFL